MGLGMNIGRSVLGKGTSVGMRCGRYFRMAFSGDGGGRYPAYQDVKNSMDHVLFLRLYYLMSISSLFHSASLFGGDSGSSSQMALFI